MNGSASSAPATTLSSPNPNGTPAATATNAGPLTSNDSNGPPPEKRRRHERVNAACNTCKMRKVKCDGLLPCAYCKRRNRPDGCAYSGARQRGPATSSSPKTAAQGDGAGTGAGSRQGRVVTRRRSSGIREGREEVGTEDDEEEKDEVKGDEDTVVPREARLLCDAQGKLIFIGDSAPLSFLQTVRHLIISRVDPNGFATHTSRDSMFEHALPSKGNANDGMNVEVDPKTVIPFVEEYLDSTHGLIDLFDRDELVVDIEAWASTHVKSYDVGSAVYYLVLAIGAQEVDEAKSEQYFNHAKNLMLAAFCGSMNIATIRGFVLLSIYMLRSFQPNGSFLFFSLAARTAYSIGIHRTEVNAHFGTVMHSLRDRIWKSLRIVDLFLSCSLGRPPATSDIDCTVPYGLSKTNTSDSDIIDASVQVFLIIERIIVEIYSRKQISISLAENISHQLKEWATRWLHILTASVSFQPDSPTDKPDRGKIVGACQALCSYYYGVMLLTRPFLIYELHEYLSYSPLSPSAGENAGVSTTDKPSDKSKFANAALDAAVLFVDLVERLIEEGQLLSRMPLIVSWLFTTSLVLGLSLLGRQGQSFQAHACSSIRCLEHFAHMDPHARQYSLIADSLLKTATKHAEKRAQQERLLRTQMSSQLFGLLPSTSATTPTPQSHMMPERMATRDANRRLLSSLNNDSRDINSGAPSANATTMADNILEHSDVSTGNNSHTNNNDWTTALNGLETDFFSLPTLNGTGLLHSQHSHQHNQRNGSEDSLGGLPLFPVFDSIETFDFGGLGQIL